MSDKQDENSKLLDLGKANDKITRAAVILMGSLYEQTLLALSQSVENLQSHDPEKNRAADASDDVGSPLADAATQAMEAVAVVQQAGRSMMQLAQTSPRYSQAEIEQAVQRTLRKLGIPSRERVERLSNKVDELTALIDRRLAERQATEEAVPPLENYGDLTVKQIMDRLNGLDAAELTDLRAYEESHRKRVTLLREIDRRIMALTGQTLI
jgi:hypothetical protein